MAPAPGKRAEAPALNSAARSAKGDRAAGREPLRARGGGLGILVGDDHADDAGDGDGEQDRFALPEGDDAGPADLVGAADTRRIDAGDHAVAEEGQHFLPLLLWRGL